MSYNSVSIDNSVASEHPMVMFGRNMSSSIRFVAFPTNPHFLLSDPELGTSSAVWEDFNDTDMSNLSVNDNIHHQASSQHTSKPGSYDNDRKSLM